ncbi:hypothetical protein [Streptodolium elevatio]
MRVRSRWAAARQRLSQTWLVDSSKLTRPRRRAAAEARMRLTALLMDPPLEVGTPDALY